MKLAVMYLADVTGDIVIVIVIACAVTLVLNRRTLINIIDYKQSNGIVGNVEICCRENRKTCP